ncbi:MAG TPA: galactonate dehydratase [Bacteroidales bacterium]|jgi:galactonate dehydratase|nr:MAG: D-galactonate dehydratase [Bacteroidetes bacterium ADurb.Bin145]HOU01341.1 galactonate dehydratase [Bacteroidales bacterium]HQK67424.1 galactonate dehydratase [Bacteroidales bacterium]
MAHNKSRRNWLKQMTAGMAGLLTAEQLTGKHFQPEGKENILNPQKALIAPRETIKITKLEIIPVNTLRTIFIKLHTDAGITGVGEGTVEGRISTTAAAIGELENYLIGKDPRRPAHHWQAIYRHAFYRGDIVLTSALSAVDIAMWDIKGKALGVPIYELLGGPTRDRIRVYGQAGDPEGAKQVINEGYKSMKVSATYSRGRLSRIVENPDFIQGMVENVSAIRDVIGPKTDMGIELHGDHSPQTSMLLIKALEPFQPWFFEEPIQFQNLPLMAEMAKKTHIPFATGERMVTKWQFRDLLSLGAASLLQPDVTHCGGITEMKAIAILAEAFYASMLPHAKEGIVGAVASMHVAASIPNLLAHELPSLQAAPEDGVKRSALGKSYIKKPLVMGNDGHIALAGNIDGPGLGIELDDDLIENERGVKEWEFPEMWDSFDGSVLDH